MIPSPRLRVVGDRPARPDGDHVLYLMTAARRTRHSFALQHAIELSRSFGRPLLVLESLRLRHRYSSDRVHRFVVQGMADQARSFAAAGVRYHAFVEREEDQGRGLVSAATAGACAVVVDRSPAYFLPRLGRAIAVASPVRVDEVDGIGLLPLSATTRPWPSAAHFRRHHQRELPTHLVFPEPEPLARYAGGWATLPAALSERWPHATDLLAAPDGVRGLAGGAAPAPDVGGQGAGAVVLERFLASRLARYADRNHPDADSASGLSPWLHFGHVSVHEIVARVLARQEWSPALLGKATGSREGWWKLPPEAESFLDELLIWRELAHTSAALVPDNDRYGALPAWARATLAAHAGDARRVESRQRLESATTSDPLWNAAQRQLVGEGRIHNYLRMLWGKKVLEWSESPEAAFETLLDLNDRYALDGRDPNTIAGVGWVFGRYDRPWFPERPIYGTVRYMTSDSARKKLDLERWLDRWSR